MKGPISKPKKRAVFERDGWRCQYCGAQQTEYTVDHIIPMSLGGSHEIDNLRTCCRTCNSTKQDRSVEWLRLYIALSFTKYSGVITLSQYHQLLGLGVALEPLPVAPFFFEMSK